jgi:4-hydroxymandelate oxidase
MEPLNVFDFETLAREKLPQMAYDYYASGAHDEITLAENHAAYDRIRLLHRVLVDVGRRNLATTVLGRRVSMPILIAPTAFHCMAHPEGEIATVRAAGAAETIMVLSTLSNTAVEDVMAAASGPVWFQLYIYRDRGATQALVRRVQQAGCSALVVTVDAPLLGRRERDVRNRFQLPRGLSVKNLQPAGMADLPKETPDSGLAAYFASLLDQTPTWKDIEWLRSITELPVLLKGIVRTDDAIRAVEHGAAGIVVSNHGGRQLDTSPATITVLPGIAEAVAGRIEVLMDGGVRRGTDVVKAIALGAKAVLVGRPILWGLAADGERGVARVLEILRFELDLAMALCGCATVNDIGRDLVDIRGVLSELLPPVRR